MNIYRGRKKEINLALEKKKVDCLCDLTVDCHVRALLVPLLFPVSESRCL